MLKKILSPKSCAGCRVCCEFGREDIWEIPLIKPELAEKLKNRFELVPSGKNFVFDMKFDDEGLSLCPALGEKGCTLGDEKPFDCKVWPLRAMKLDKRLVITVSPVCKCVSALSAEKLSEFVGSVADIIYKEAEKNPEAVKDYIDGYPIFSVKGEA